jgi:2-keto-4-pentenoate hydratase
MEPARPTETRVAELEAEVARLKRELAKRGQEALPAPAQRPAVPIAPRARERGNGSNHGQMIEHGSSCQCLACRAAVELAAASAVAVRCDLHKLLNCSRDPRCIAQRQDGDDW